MKYVLITAARNEHRYISHTLESVVGQNLQPSRWVIVSDGSTDGTDELVMEYAAKCHYISLLRMEDEAGRSFASQAYALNHAVRALWSEDFDFIGCLDADISLDSDYYQEVLEAFAVDPALGVAGGSIHEWAGDTFRPRPSNSPRSVAGAIQMFRRSCFERIGAFTPVPHGGLDTVAETKARMSGFRVRSLPELAVRHLRPTGGEGGPISGSFNAGLMEHEIGYHPLFELFACARRARGPRSLLRSLVHLGGFAFAGVTLQARMVPAEVMRFLRRDQLARLLAFAKGVLLHARFDGQDL